MMSQENGQNAESADGARHGPALSAELGGGERLRLPAMSLRLLLSWIAGVITFYGINALYRIMFTISVEFWDFRFVDKMEPVLHFIMIVCAGLAGGLVSGWSLWDAIRDCLERFWRFFVLGLASPASFIWTTEIISGLTGTKPTGRKLLMIFFFCIAAVSGSLAGYRLGWRQDVQRRRREEKDRRKEEAIGQHVQYHGKGMEEEKSDLPGEDTGG